MTDTVRIVLDQQVLAGKPVVQGTRLSVEFVVGLLADGWSEADILENYPNLHRDEIRACLAYARDALASEKMRALTLADPFWGPRFGPSDALTAT